MSVILMVHVWLHMDKKQPAAEAKQTPRLWDFALRSLGVIRLAQSPLCSTKQSPLHAPGYSFVLPLRPFPAQCHDPSRLPKWMGLELYSRTGTSPLPSLPKAKEVSIWNHWLSHPNPVAAYPNSFPDPRGWGGRRKCQEVADPWARRGCSGAAGIHSTAPIMIKGEQTNKQRIFPGPLKTKLSSCSKRNL